EPEQQPPRKARETRHAETGESAEHKGDGGGHRRNSEADQCCGAECFVMEQHAIPAGREPRPNRNQARTLERVEGKQQDRCVKEAKPQCQCHEPEPARCSTPDHAACTRSRNRWAARIGIVNIAISATATAAATGQSRLLKNSSHSTLPIIKVSGPPSRSGITNSPTAGMSTRSEPAAIPGNDNGRVTPRNARNGRAPRSAAASMRLLSSADKLPYRGRTMNGRYE